METWQLISDSIVIIGILFLILIFKFYLPSYVSEKAKNLATKKDIADITKATEEIRTVYAKQLENMLQQNRIILEEYRNRNQLKLAALDRRLEAHQQAYILWRKVVNNVHNQNTIMDVVIECQEWWHKNLLYLTAKARDAFWESFMSASLHRDLLQIHRQSPSEKTKKEIKENWDKIMIAGKLIVESVTLPPTNEQLEIKELNLDNT